MHLTLWEECLPWPLWAALGASVLLYSVPPSSLNPSCPSGPSSGPNSPTRSAWSGHRYSTAAPAVHSGMQYGLLVCVVGVGKQWWRMMGNPHPHNHSDQSLHHLLHPPNCCHPHDQDYLPLGFFPG